MNVDRSVSLGGGNRSALPTVCLIPSRSSTPLSPSLANTSVRKCLCSSRDQYCHSALAPVNLGVRLSILCCLLTKEPGGRWVWPKGRGGVCEFYTQIPTHGLYIYYNHTQGCSVIPARSAAMFFGVPILLQNMKNVDNFSVTK